MLQEESLRAITCNAARICGINDRVGSIAPGKDADLVLFDKNPFDGYIKPTAVYIRGQKIK